MIYVVILLIVVAVLKPLDIKYRKGYRKSFCLFDIGFLLTFAVLSFFSSIRDDIGCDYHSYVSHIERIQSGLPNYMEPGFQYVVIQLAKYDDNPRTVIVLFGILTCFFFLKSIWDQSQDRFMSVFLFLTWGLYFMTFNTIRNYFALSLVYFAIKYLIGKRSVLFYVVVLIAAFFHKSALICVPLYFLANRISLKKSHIPIIIVVTFLLLLLQAPLRSLAFDVYSSYEGSEYDVGRISYLNIVKAVLIIGLSLKYKMLVYSDKLLKFYFNLNVFALVIYTGAYWLPEISRIGFYLNMTAIFLIPSILQSIRPSERNTLNRLVVIFSVFLFILLLFSFTSPTTGLLPYKTWLIDGKYKIV